MLGTRINEEKIKQGQAFAKERKLPLLDHVLLPRTKGVYLRACVCVCVCVVEVW